MEILILEQKVTPLLKKQNGKKDFFGQLIMKRWILLPQKFYFKIPGAPNPI